MKTQAIHLNRHDDVISVQDRISWAKSERILLVWPHGGKYLNSQLDLVRIQRHCKQYGSDLALVARIPKIVHHAQSLNIPVFRSVREAQRSSWASSLLANRPVLPNIKRKYSFTALQKINQKEASPPENQITRMVFFATGLIAFFAILSIFVPSAKITLSSNSEIQDLEFEVNASTAYKRPDLSGHVPAQIFQIIVDGEDTLIPSGSIEIPQEPATGNIEFTNLTDREIYIPSGTTIRTRTEPSIRFHTLDPVTLPAEAGVTVGMAIEAENPGSHANLPADSLNVIDGELGLSLAANNPVATAGGSERSSAAPNEEDYEKLKQQVLDVLWQKALADVSVGLEANDFVVNVQPIAVEVLEETFIPAEPSPASALDLLMRVEYQILVVRYSALTALAHPILDQNLGKGFSTVPNSLILIPVTEPVFTTNDTAYWQLHAQRTVHTQIDPYSLIDLLRGKNLSTANDLLNSQYPFASPATIEMTPNWWPWLPLLSFRIEVSQ